MSEHIYALSSIDLIPAGPTRGIAIVTPAAANTYGSWTQLLASAAEDLYIVGALMEIEGTYTQLDIGIGIAAAEVSKAVIKTYTTSYVPINPPLKIPSGSRIAGRLADSTSTSQTLYITLFYVPVSAIVNPVLEEVESPNGTIVADGSNTASTFKTNLTQSTNDFWKSPTLVKFKTGVLTGQTRALETTGSYDGTTKFLTVSDAFTTTPTADDTFDLINR